MRKIKRELMLFFMGNIYLWVYYLLAVLVNKAHPLDAYATVMIIGGFLGIPLSLLMGIPLDVYNIIVFIGGYLGIPLLMFVGIPIINGKIIAKRYKVKMTSRIIVYIILSMPLLCGLFGIHMTISNHLVKNEFFPEGIETVAMKHFDELQEISRGEIKLLSYEYRAPYHLSIKLGNGTLKPSIDIEYEYVDCLPGDCKQKYSVEYDLHTGKPTHPVAPKESLSLPHKELKWAKEFDGEYIGVQDGLRYTLLAINHATDGEKIIFKRNEPYFDIDVLIQRTNRDYTKGEIKEGPSNHAKGSFKEDDFLAGKTVEFIKEGNQVEVLVDGVSRTTLKLTHRR